MLSSGRVLVSLAIAVGTWAQSSYLASDLSFGHERRISPDLNEIPNWRVLGEPNRPNILSNKIILTPPVSANQRGAVWCDRTLQDTAWTADVDFRATGPERGDGKFVVWLARNGRYEVGTSSIYTVGKFDGLALNIDTYAGTAGTVRGFLNDGQTDYKSHHSVDSLAFGHCSYSYRNLGRMSRLKVKQDPQNFQVSIDGSLCFESTKIRLPIGYSFGITAVSGENPDSFEVTRFVVTTQKYDYDAQNQGLLHDNVSPGSSGDPNKLPNVSGNTADSEDPPEIDADKIETNRQFADLHNRMQALMKHLSNLQRDYMSGRQEETQKLTAIHNMLSKQQYSKGSSGVASDEILKQMDKRLQDMELKIQDMANQITHIKYAVADTGHIEDLKRTVKEQHTAVLSAAPKHGFLIFTIIASQVLLVVAYVIYDKRRAKSAKKYL